MGAEWKVVFDAKSLLPLANRVVLLGHPKKRPSVTLSDPAAVADLLSEISGLDREAFYVFLLDGDNGLIGIYIASLGGIAFSIVDPLVVCRVALASGAQGVVFAHNHPSGTLTPSREDITLTKALRAALAVLDVVVCDHIIISRDGFHSISPAETFGARPIT